MPSETPEFAPLAIVGMACRFPGADDIEQFWELIRDGRSGIAEIPPDRLDQRLYYEPDRDVVGKSYSNIAGIVPIRPVDRTTCPIEDDLHDRSDVAHLMMCEIACQAVRNAGYDPAAFPQKQTGVYIGNSSGSNLEADLTWNSHADEVSALIEQMATSAGVATDSAREAAKAIRDSIRSQTVSCADSPVQNMTSGSSAGLIAEVLKLDGPHLAVDAACASSFVALHLAAMELNAGRIDAAIVGAFSFRNWYEMVLLSPTQALSPTGSRPFCANADGMVPSDGYAAVVVKTLDQALSAGDPIVGVIRSMGVSSDGRGKGFWAPRPEGQIAAIQRAYTGKFSPSELQFIEAHATSTQLGDPTEAGSLQAAIGQAIPERIPFSSVKANIGHTLEVAGFAGLLKTLLSMQHKQIPPAIDCAPLNTRIDWDSLPFYPPQQTLPWPPRGDAPRRAGVNSFGIGGLNVHLIVDQSPMPEEQHAHAAITPVEAEREQIAIVGLASPVLAAKPVNRFLDLCGVETPSGLSDETAYKFDWKKHRVPPKQLETANSLQFMILDAAVMALEAAGLNNPDLDRSSVGTVVGSVFTSDYICDAFVGVRFPEIKEQLEQILTARGVAADQTARVCDLILNSLNTDKPATQDVTASYSSSTLASMISKHLDLMGGAFSVDADDAYPEAALTSAIDLLQSQTCNVVICAVGQRLSDRTYVEGTRFGRRLPLGVGAAAVALKRLSDAQRDQNQILHVFPADFVSDLRSGSRQEQSAPVASSSAEKTHAGHKTATDSAQQMHDPIDIVSGLIVDQTGLPIELVTADALLRDDLGLTAENLRVLYEELAPWLPLSAEQNHDSEQPKTVADFCRQLKLESAEPREAHPSAPTHFVASTGSPDAVDIPDLERCVLRTIETQRPDNDNSQTALPQTALILGNNPAAEALKTDLGSKGVTVYQLDVSANLTEQFQQLSATIIPSAMFVVSGRDPLPAVSMTAVEEAKHASERLTWILGCIQQWVTRISTARVISESMLIAVTSAGGDFGTGGRVASIESCGVAGLLKSIAAETEGRLLTRIIDAPANEPNKMISANVIREMSFRNVNTEVASVRGKLQTCRLIPDSRHNDTPLSIRPGSIWLVTGQMQNSTAAVLCEMGSRLGLHLHFLDPNPATDVDDSLRNLTAEQTTELRWRVMREAKAAGNSPLEAWRRLAQSLATDAVLKSLKQSGVACEWHMCDVSRQDELEPVLESIRQDDGPIEGILHCCDSGQAARFEKKQPEVIERVLREQLLHPAVLLDATANEPLQDFVILTDGSGRFGNALQTDIAMAQDALCGLVARFAAQHPDCSTSIVHSTLASFAPTASIESSPPVTAAGLASNVTRQVAAQIVDAMQFAPGYRQIVISEQVNRDSQEHGVTAADRELCRDSERLIIDSPMVDRVIAGETVAGIAEISFNPLDDPFLTGHLDRNVPLLPAVVGIETCAEAASIWSGGRSVVAIRDQQIMNGFRMAGPQIHHGRILIRPDGNTTHCAMIGEFHNKKGELTDPHRLFQTCEVELADALTPLPLPDLGPSPTDWTTLRYPPDWQTTEGYDIDAIFFGPELRTLKSVYHQVEGSWGQMLAPQLSDLGGRRRGSGWHTPPALIDGALFLCGLHASHNFQTKQLPHVIDRIDFGRLPLPNENCIARCLFRNKEGRRITWDFWIFGEDGAVILACQGFHATIL